MDVLTLKWPVNLVFNGLTQELVVVLLPLDISRVEIGLGLPNSMTEDPYKTKISPLSRKIKRIDLLSSSMPQGKRR